MSIIVHVLDDRSGSINEDEAVNTLVALSLLAVNSRAIQS
jgi:hypothetical protein